MTLYVTGRFIPALAARDRVSSLATKSHILLNPPIPSGI
jgi:hypothetical protein